MHSSTHKPLITFDDVRTKILPEYVYLTILKMRYDTQSYPSPDAFLRKRNVDSAQTRWKIMLDTKKLVTEKFKYYVYHCTCNHIIN